MKRNKEITLEQASKAAFQAVKSMTPKQALSALVRAGICNEDGSFIEHEMPISEYLDSLRAK